MGRWGCVLVALIGLAVVIGGIGLFLPTEHVAVETAVVHAPPARIAALIRAVEAEPRWLDGVAAVRLHGRTGTTAHYSEVDRDGRSHAIELREAERNRWFERTMGDDGAAFRGHWTIVLDPVPEGTRVAIDERGEVRWPLLGLVANWLRRPDAAIRAYARDLARAAQRPPVSRAAPPATVAAR